MGTHEHIRTLLAVDGVFLLSSQRGENEPVSLKITKGRQNTCTHTHTHTHALSKDKKIIIILNIFPGRVDNKKHALHVKM